MERLEGVVCLFPSLCKRQARENGEKMEIWGPWWGKRWVGSSSSNPLAASIQDLKACISGGVKSVIINQLMNIHLPGGLCTAEGQQKPIMGLALGHSMSVVGT